MSHARTVMAAVPPARTPGTPSTPSLNTPSTSSRSFSMLSSRSPKRISKRPFATVSLEPSAARSGEAVAEFLALKVPATAMMPEESRIPLKFSIAGGAVSPPPRPTTEKVDEPKPDPAAWASAYVAPARVSQARTVMVALPPAATPGTVSTPREKTPSTSKVFSAVLSTVSL